MEVTVRAPRDHDAARRFLGFGVGWCRYRLTRLRNWVERLGWEDGSLKVGVRTRIENRESTLRRTRSRLVLGRRRGAECWSGGWSGLMLAMGKATARERSSEPGKSTGHWKMVEGWKFTNGKPVTVMAKEMEREEGKGKEATVGRWQANLDVLPFVGKGRRPNVGMSPSQSVWTWCSSAGHPPIAVASSLQRWSGFGR